MEIKLFLLIIALPFNMLGQGSRNCVLLDSKTHEPVPYVTIGAGSFTIYSDLQGRFPSDRNSGDTIRISRLGYKSMRISKSELRDTMFLTPERYTLNEVEISVNSRVFEVGLHDFKTYGTAATKSHALGVYISCPPRPAKINAIIVATRGNHKGNVYGINLFAVDSDGSPKDLIGLPI